MTQSNDFDKMESESARAFDAFRTYRDMGASRTLRGAYRLKTGIKQAKAASGQWVQWYERHDWKRRAGAWDGEQDILRREEAADLHRLEMETYRRVVIERAQAMGEASTLLLEKAMAALETVDMSKARLSDISGLLSAAALALEKAARLEGIGLGVLDATGEPLAS